MEPQFVRHVAFGLVIWATMLLSRSTCLRSCSFPAIFNFGDSNSDTGGLSAAFGQAPYPNGETFFRTPSGRYSDGRLIIDFIGIPSTENYLVHGACKFLQLQSLLLLLFSPFIMLVVSHHRFLFENTITKAVDLLLNIILLNFSGMKSGTVLPVTIL